MTRCDRPGCTGTIGETGFCDTCGHRPTVRREPAAAPDQDPVRRPSQVDLDRELTSLPVFPFPDPSSRVLTDPVAPERRHTCVRCRHPIGGGHAGQPTLAEGFCPRCRERYSFLPSLPPGVLVAGQYKVVGCLARGGLGWVYLARDTNLDDTFVVLKGVIDVGDAGIAVAERRALTSLNHPNIVRIVNFVTHPDPRTGTTRDYIVMEYVDGLVLSDVRNQALAGGEPLGEPFRVEHVIVCGLQILAAFDYLHGKGLLYCDMKPDNVIVRSGQHGERVNRVRLIDLGAVRRIGEDGGRIIYTEPYTVGRAEIEEHGLTVRSDLHTLGVTLQHLFDATVDRVEQAAGTSPVAEGLRSFCRVLVRAMDDRPEHRFPSAARMADQLRGVYREIASLRDGQERPEPSTMFAPTAALLDSGLGAVPPLERWVVGGGGVDVRTGDVAALAVETPRGVAAAAAMAAPHVDRDDPAAEFLTVAAAPDARRLLAKLAAATHDSPEVWFARCRAHLELGELDGAADSARQAGQRLGAAREHDWRVPWHAGLLALAGGDTGKATREFDAVRDALPGEEAPALALACCAEAGGQLMLAERLYTAVWHRDRLQVGAAFGLARIRLVHGDRARAVAVLDGVPKTSRHADAAAVAGVLVLAHRLGADPPDAEDLRTAAERLPALYLDGGEDGGEARDRLTAVVREAALDWTRHHAGPLPEDGGAVFGDRPDENVVRRLLEHSYQALARQARDPDSHGVLVDRANAVRPMTNL